MKKTKYLLFLMCIGSIGYCTLEIIWRGYTHWTMALLGGICLPLIFMVDDKFRFLTLTKRAIICSAIITVLELFVGLIVNVSLGLNVWNYSDRFLNLFGQICPLYSFLWFVLCFVILKGKRKLQQKIRQKRSVPLHPFRVPTKFKN